MELAIEAMKNSVDESYKNTPCPKVGAVLVFPDGTSLNITTDYLANPVNTKKVMPGPFQEIKSKRNKFIIWPKMNDIRQQKINSNIHFYFPYFRLRAKA